MMLLVVWALSAFALGRWILSLPHELGHWSVRRSILGWPASIRLAAPRGALRKLTVCGVRLRLGRGWWRISRRSVATVPWPIDVAAGNLLPAYDSDGTYIARHAGHPKAVAAGLALIAFLLLASSVLAAVAALR